MPDLHYPPASARRADSAVDLSTTWDQYVIDLAFRQYGAAIATVQGAAHHQGVRDVAEWLDHVAASLHGTAAADLLTSLAVELRGPTWLQRGLARGEMTAHAATISAPTDTAGKT